MIIMIIIDDDKDDNIDDILKKINLPVCLTMTPFGLPVDPDVYNI